MVSGVKSYVKNSETIGRAGAVEEITLKFEELYKHVYTRNGQLDPAVIGPLITGELPTSSAACAAMARDCKSRVPLVEPPALSLRIQPHSFIWHVPDLIDCHAS